MSKNNEPLNKQLEYKHSLNYSLESETLKFKINSVNPVYQDRPFSRKFILGDTCE